MIIEKKNFFIYLATYIFLDITGQLLIHKVKSQKVRSTFQLSILSYLKGNYFTFFLINRHTAKPPIALMLVPAKHRAIQNRAICG